MAYMFENGEDLIKHVRSELSREYEMKVDSVMSEKAFQIAEENILDYFKDYDQGQIEELDKFVEELNEELDPDECDDLNVAIIKFNEEGEQVDIFSGNPQMDAGQPPEWFCIHMS